MSHFVGARLGADSTQPIKIEAVSRKLLFLGAFRETTKKLEACF
jgi:hypothetical protein